MNKSIFLAAILLIPALVSCSSSPRRTEDAMVVGLVIDEDNKPVRDYEVRIFGSEVTYTDEGGLFCFTDVRGRKTKVSGTKSGWCSFSEELPVIQGRVFCIQVQTAESKLSEINLLVQNEEYRKALENLNLICTDRKPWLKDVVCFYKDKIKEKLKNEKNI